MATSSALLETLERAETAKDLTRGSESAQALGYDDRATRKAWETFLSGEAARQRELPVRSLIIESWRRSTASGVTATAQAAPLAADEYELHRRRTDSDELISAAQLPVARLDRLLSSVPAMIILTDRDGVIIETVGNAKTLDQGLNINLQAGGAWHEDLIGTNGIGTALATGQPVFVHAGEHFCEGIKHWTCAGVPIRDPVDDSILGVIDLSGPPEIFQPHNIHFVTSAARQIERTLAESALLERARLLEVFLGGAEAIRREDGLLIVDRRGRVVFARNTPPWLDASQSGQPVTIGRQVLALNGSANEADVAAALPSGLQQLDVCSLHLDGVARGTAIVFQSEKRVRTSVPQGSIRRPTSPGIRIEQLELVGESEAFKEAVERTRQLAAGTLPLLFEGETGVGKELFAQMAHLTANPASRATIHATDHATARDPDHAPFHVISCGAIPEARFEAELFGDDARGISPFGLAEGGSLCLDEIGDIPLDLQPCLLRAVEQRSIQRTGDIADRPASVRILATTSRCLKHEVESGRFRRDLFFRMSMATIRIPPLRERQGDIPLLLNHFNHAISRQLGSDALAFDDEAFASLYAYHWPGNVRELRNLIEMLHLTCTSRRVSQTDLPSSITSGSDVAAVPMGAGGMNDFAQAERMIIEKAIRSERGNMKRVAAVLSMSRATLYRKMQVLGIRRSAVATIA